MNEIDSEYQESHRQELIALLSQDFKSPEDRAVLEDPNAGALSKLLANMTAIEDFEERISSDECLELVKTTGQALEPAPITATFKGVIIGNVMRAFAAQSAINESVSSAKLGLTDGQGIFDPEQAKDIEGQALRDYLSRLINTHVYMPESEGESTDVELFILNPMQYGQELDVFDTWVLEYISQYGEDAFAGIEPHMHIDSAQRVRLISDEEAKASNWDKLFERLRQLRDQNRPE